MIQGLQIDVSSTELKEHIQGRAKHHKEKAEWYEKQVRNLKEGGVTESMASNDPTSSLQRSAEYNGGQAITHGDVCFTFGVVQDEPRHAPRRRLH